MPNTPDKFRGGASIRPVGGAGRAQAQRPNTESSSKKSGALLRDLERTKLEGDPLTLLGSGTEPTVSGEEPLSPPEQSTGTRLVFFERDSPPYRVAIGVDGDRTLWFQSTGDPVSADTEEAGYDWWCAGSATGSLARRMRLTDAGKLLLGLGDPVLNARLTIEFGAISLGHSEVSNGGTLSVNIGTGAVVIADATGGACTVNLPLASDSEGCSFTVKRVNAGANSVVLDGNGTETIDGAATKSLDSQFAAIVVYCDGIEWHITSQMGTVT